MTRLISEYGHKFHFVLETGAFGKIFNIYRVFSIFDHLLDYMLLSCADPEGGWGSTILTPPHNFPVYGS